MSILEINGENLDYYDNKIRNHVNSQITDIISNEVDEKVTDFISNEIDEFFKIKFDFMEKYLYKDLFQGSNFWQGITPTDMALVESLFEYTNGALGITPYIHYILKLKNQRKIVLVGGDVNLSPTSTTDMSTPYNTVTKYIEADEKTYTSTTDIYRLNSTYYNESNINSSGWSRNRLTLGYNDNDERIPIRNQNSLFYKVGKMTITEHQGTIDGYYNITETYQQPSKDLYLIIPPYTDIQNDPYLAIITQYRSHYSAANPPILVEEDGYIEPVLLTIPPDDIVSINYTWHGLQRTDDKVENGEYYIKVEGNYGDNDIKDEQGHYILQNNDIISFQLTNAKDIWYGGYTDFTLKCFENQKHICNLKIKGSKKTIKNMLTKPYENNNILIKIEKLLNAVEYNNSPADTVPEYACGLIVDKTFEGMDYWPYIDNND